MSEFIDGPVLGLETTGRLTGAALVLRGRMVAEASVDVRAGSAEVLLSLIERVLQSHALVPRDLARVGVALGPGSFTGLRVGIAAARGLALGAGVAAVGIPSHQALAWPWRDLGRTIVLLTGMRRGQVFLEAGRFDGDTWKERLPAVCLPSAEVPPLIAGLPEAGRLLFAGEAVESVCQLFESLRRIGAVVRDDLASCRRPAAVAALAARTGLVELRGEALDALNPLYLRGADAKPPEA